MSGCNEPQLSPALAPGGDFHFAQDLIAQLVRRRHELGLSQVDLDYRIGAPEGQIAKWETGYRKPTAFNLWCWAQALHCQLVVTPSDT